MNAIKSIWVIHLFAGFQKYCPQLPLDNACAAIHDYMGGGVVMKKTALFFLIAFLASGFFAFADNAAEFDLVFKRIAQKLSAVEARLPNKTVAVYGFDVIGRPGDTYAIYATEKLTHELVNAGRLLVIERSRITEVLKEQSFSVTDVVDAGTAARIGKLLSVDAVVTGTILVTETRTEFIVRVITSEKGIILTSVDDGVTYTVSAAGDQDATGSTGASSAARLVLEKTVYGRGEKISVTVSGLQGSETDWITLVKADDPVDTYGQWFYTKGKKAETFVFSGVVPGEYEIRVYYDWPAGGYEVQQQIKILVQ